MLRPVLVWVFTALLVCASMAGAQTASLTLDQAIERALTRSPQFLQAGADAEVAQARLREDRVWWRPTLDVEFENVLGDGPYADFDAVETTWSLSQELPLGGPRSQAVRGSTAGRDAAVANVELVKRELRRDVAIAYAEDRGRSHCRHRARAGA